MSAAQRLGRWRNAWIDRVRRRDAFAEVAFQLGEPLGREHPRAGLLEAGQLAVGDVAERRHENRRVNGRRDLPAFDERQALLVAMPGWRRVEDGPAADCRLAAQDDAVAPGRDDRRRKAKLSPALPDAHDSRLHARCPYVDVETRAVGDRLELVERDVEPERDRVRVVGDERLAARDLPALDARQADGDALPGFRPWDVAVVYLDAANAHGHARRLDPQLVSRADRARPERSRDDGADAAQRERPVHPETRRAIAARILDAVRGATDRHAQLVDPQAGLRADGDDLRAGYQLPGLLHREVENVRVHRVGLRHRDDASLDAEQTQDREVLVRLRPRALAGIDDEQEEVDAGRPGDHRADEALVPGHVDDRGAPAVRKLERRIAEVDRDAATLLLREAVRVLAGQCPDEPGLAVVDVTRSADRQRHVRGA